MRDEGVVLLVDPERAALATFEEILGESGSVVCTDFITARRRLLEDPPPGVIVTNLRLEAYNGLHLVYLAAALGLRSRCIVYSDHEDAPLLQDARSAGAAYESKQRIRGILASYASGKPTTCGEPSPLSVERPPPSPRARRHACLRG
jgi:DNA-binding NtrC family response regulator